MQAMTHSREETYRYGIPFSHTPKISSIETEQNLTENASDKLLKKKCFKWQKGELLLECF